MNKNKNPTDLQLYYDGSYIGKWAIFEIFRYQDKFFAMVDGKTAEIDNFDLAIVMN